MRRLAKKFLSGMVARLVDAADCFNGRDYTLLSCRHALQHRYLVRWGDGETSLALGLSTSFQGAERSLARELRALLRFECDSLVMCFPRQVMRRFPFSARDLDPRLWALTAMLIRLLFRKDAYGDAFMFRAETGLGASEELRAILRRSERVAIVSSSEEMSRHAMLALDPAATWQLSHLTVPAVNAYEQKPAIRSWIESIGEPDLILFSAGPVGKIIIHEMARIGSKSQLIDVGHFFPHLLKSACIEQIPSAESGSSVK